jgi:ArsR family transcriptional regulator
MSAHLATLQKAGLITSHKVGQWSYFKRDEATIQAFIDHMNTGL